MGGRTGLAIPLNRPVQHSQSTVPSHVRSQSAGPLPFSRFLVWLIPRPLHMSVKFWSRLRSSIVARHVPCPLRQAFILWEHANTPRHSRFHVINEFLSVNNISNKCPYTSHLRRNSDRCEMSWKLDQLPLHGLKPINLNLEPKSAKHNNKPNYSPRAYVHYPIHAEPSYTHATN